MRNKMARLLRVSEIFHHSRILSWDVSEKALPKDSLDTLNTCFPEHARRILHLGGAKSRFKTPRTGHKRSKDRLSGSLPCVFMPECISMKLIDPTGRSHRCDPYLSSSTPDPGKELGKSFIPRTS